MDEPLDLSWRQYGACVGKPTEWWYPTSVDKGHWDHRALELCEGCPVRQACLAWALEHEDQGIWAGTSERERRRIRSKAGIRLDTITLDPRAMHVQQQPAAATDPFEESA